MEHHNSSAEEKVMDDLLCCKDVELVFKLVDVCFGQESRKESGKTYLPPTIRTLPFKKKLWRIGWLLMYWTITDFPFCD